jgi:hypothetical protein
VGVVLLGMDGWLLPYVGNFRFQVDDPR